MILLQHEAGADVVSAVTWEPVQIHLARAKVQARLVLHFVEMETITKVQEIAAHAKVEAGR